MRHDPRLLIAAGSFHQGEVNQWIGDYGLPFFGSQNSQNSQNSAGCLSPEFLSPRFFSCPESSYITSFCRVTGKAIKRQLDSNCLGTTRNTPLCHQEFKSILERALILSPDHHYVVLGDRKPGISEIPRIPGDVCSPAGPSSPVLFDVGWWRRWEHSAKHCHRNTEVWLMRIDLTSTDMLIP